MTTATLDSSARAALPIGEAALPAALSMRTKKGRKYAAEKARLAVELRKQGYTLKSISAALGSAEQTLSMYIWKHDPRLMYASHATKQYSPQTTAEAVSLVDGDRQIRLSRQQARIADYRERRRRGERLPWHRPEHPEPQRTQWQVDELAVLIAQQDREMERRDKSWGERPRRSKSVGMALSLDERSTSKSPDRQGGTSPEEWYEYFTGGAHPSAEEEVIEAEFAAELREATGNISDDRIERLDGETEAWLRDKLRDAGLAGVSVQGKERARAQRPERHRGYAPPATFQRLSTKRRSRRDQIALMSGKRISRRARRKWDREKVVYDWKAAA